MKDMIAVPVAGRLVTTVVMDDHEPVERAVERAEEELALELLDRGVVGIESLLRYAFNGDLGVVGVSIDYIEWPPREWDGRSLLEMALAHEARRKSRRQPE